MNPILVNAWRGSAIESRHRGAIAVFSVDGKPVFSVGDVQRPVFGRSAVKFIQAIPLVESGAYEALGLDERHLSLACASHNGEPGHIELVNSWLAKLGYDDDAFECGADLPGDDTSRTNLLADGGGPRRMYHCCSGKHLGFLSTCKHLNEPTHNYRLYNHAAQRRWFEVMEQVGSTRLMQLPWGYDGCAIPSIAMPLQRIALAMARFAAPRQAPGLADSRIAAIEKIQTALVAEPYFLAGEERLCTDLIRVAPSVLAKVGHEGVYTACIPSQGLGIALKIDDGAGRAARVALGAVLQRLGVVDVAACQQLGDYFAPSITNSRGDAIGRLEASSEWEQF